jgi:hypothetical protein
VYLYGSQAITYLNAILQVLQSQPCVSSDCPHPPLQAALPPSVWQHNLHPFGWEVQHCLITIPMLKIKLKTCTGGFIKIAPLSKKIVETLKKCLQWLIKMPALMAFFVSSSGSFKKFLRNSLTESVD